MRARRKVFVWMQQRENRKADKSSVMEKAKGLFQNSNKPDLIHWESRLPV